MVSGVRLCGMGLIIDSADRVLGRGRLVLKSALKIDSFSPTCFHYCVIPGPGTFEHEHGRDKQCNLCVIFLFAQTGPRDT